MKKKALLNLSQKCASLKFIKIKLKKYRIYELKIYLQ